METILAMRAAAPTTATQLVGLRAGGVAGGQHLGPRLQLLEVVRLGDLGDLRGLPLLVDGDDELLDLVAQPAFTSGHFDPHALKESSQVAQRIGPLADVVQAVGREASRLDRKRCRRDLARRRGGRRARNRGPTSS